MVIASPGVATPEFVYHYTNSAGLYGILSNMELWLGDVEFMNDAEELAYARPAIVADLKAKADSLWPENVDDPEQSAEWCRSQIVRMISGFLARAYAEPSEVTYHAYATCFCEDPDLLSQWRGYAGEGGYAIGFRRAVLGKIACQDAPGVTSGRFAKVYYGVQAARGALSDVVANLASYAQAHWPTEAWHQFMHQVLPIVATVKHASFAEEQEWRLVNFSWGVEDDIAFRPARIGLIPYRKIALPKEAIASIVIGPGYHPDVRRFSVDQYLRKLDLTGVEVRQSASPLRQ